MLQMGILLGAEVNAACTRWRLEARRKAGTQKGVRRLTLSSYRLPSIARRWSACGCPCLVGTPAILELELELDRIAPTPPPAP